MINRIIQYFRNKRKSVEPEVSQNIVQERGKHGIDPSLSLEKKIGLEFLAMCDGNQNLNRSIDAVAQNNPKVKHQVYFSLLHSLFHGISGTEYSSIFAETADTYLKGKIMPEPKNVEELLKNIEKEVIGQSIEYSLPNTTDISTALGTIAKKKLGSVPSFRQTLSLIEENVSSVYTESTPRALYTMTLYAGLAGIGMDDYVDNLFAKLQQEYNSEKINFHAPEKMECFINDVFDSMCRSKQALETKKDLELERIEGENPFLAPILIYQLQNYIQAAGLEDEIQKYVAIINGEPTLSLSVAISTNTKLRIHLPNNRFVCYAYDFTQIDKNGFTGEEIYESAVNATRSMRGVSSFEQLIAEGVEKERFGWYITEMPKS
jgi:hypothetical protein